MYETFDHTADVGLRIRATHFEELLVEAGRALTSVMVEDPFASDADRSESVELSADTPVDLLFDWMSELAYLFATRGFVPREYEVEVAGDSLKAHLRGWRFDPDRHAQSCHRTMSSGFRRRTTPAAISASETRTGARTDAVHGSGIRKRTSRSSRCAGQSRSTLRAAQ